LISIFFFEPDYSLSGIRVRVWKERLVLKFLLCSKFEGSFVALTLCFKLVAITLAVFCLIGSLDDDTLPFESNKARDDVHLFCLNLNCFGFYWLVCTSFVLEARSKTFRDITLFSTI
jgi:hypothetical protein